jgi:hypothetical protein
MGEEGSYSMYVDAVERTFCKSSYSKERTIWGDGIFEAFKSLDESKKVEGAKSPPLNFVDM